jgi:hypothetical protein
MQISIAKSLPLLYVNKDILYRNTGHSCKHYGVLHTVCASDAMLSKIQSASVNASTSAEWPAAEDASKLIRVHVS